MLRRGNRPERHRRLIGSPCMCAARRAPRVGEIDAFEIVSVTDAVLEVFLRYEFSRAHSTNWKLVATNLSSLTSPEHFACFAAPHRPALWALTLAPVTK